MKKTIAIDFDGVIHKYSKGWKDGAIYDEPVDGAKEAIEELMDKGYRVVIFTTRRNMLEIGDWLTEFNFPNIAVTNDKPVAIAYIDDRGIRFTNWKDMLNYF